jgi:hypothetical protein
MKLGKNPDVDDISATHLDRLRDQLFPVLGRVEPDPVLLPLLVDAVMTRAAEQMHSAVTAGYGCGHAAGVELGEDVARMVVPKDMA